jgi:hypothetical protein
MSQMGRLRNGRTRRAKAFRREAVKPGATMIQPAGHRCDLRRYTQAATLVTDPGAGIDRGG